jgi:hypothetical protein
LLGRAWWNSEAGDYSQRIFKPLQLKASVEDGNRLTLALVDPGWLTRRTDDLLPDHGHLMHLYVIRVPEMDLVWHLHPRQTGDSSFTQNLPSMPAGRYALFADIVHATGFPETPTTQIELSAIAGQPLDGNDAGDDAGGQFAPAISAAGEPAVPLSGGYRMVWERPSQPIHARQPYEFRFRVEDPSGHPADGMELYMGMQGHAAFVRSDLTVFAHVHPSGSVPMAALSLTEFNPQAAHMMPSSAAVPSLVSFPYGFPKAGDYRIIVQVKRSGRVETGIFDTRVEN